MLTFNTKSKLVTKKRTKLSNAAVNCTSDFNCRHGTLLTDDVTSASIFIEICHVYRSDREATEARKSKHGGVLTDIKRFLSMYTLLFISEIGPPALKVVRAGGNVRLC